MTRYYLGVDGGGTRCRMRLADENLETLAEVVSAQPSNLQVRDGDAAYEVVGSLTEEVYAEAGLDKSETANTSACFGIAGGRLESARIAFKQRSFPFADLEVYDDIDIARAGAHEGEDGAVLIVGTGSAGLGVMDGVRHQAGGWGFFVGDTMSGAIMGREIVRRSLLAHEQLEPPSGLSRAVMERFSNDGDALMSWSFNHPETGRPARPSHYGELVPLLFDFFDKGDPLALELMEFQLSAIDQYVSWFRDRGARAIAVVGGFGRRLYPQMEARYGDIIVEPKSEPLHGALILARQLFADT